MLFVSITVTVSPDIAVQSLVCLDWYLFSLSPILACSRHPCSVVLFVFVICCLYCLFACFCSLFLFCFNIQLQDLAPCSLYRSFNTVLYSLSTVSLFFIPSVLYAAMAKWWGVHLEARRSEITACFTWSRYTSHLPECSTGFPARCLVL